MEPTTKKWKNRKTEKKKWVCSEVSVNSLGNPWSQSRRRQEAELSPRDRAMRRVN